VCTQLEISRHHSSTSFANPEPANVKRILESIVRVHRIHLTSSSFTNIRNNAKCCKQCKTVIMNDDDDTDHEVLSGIVKCEDGS
jgi:hypothetical protein